MLQSKGYMKQYVLGEQNDTQILLEYFLRILACENAKAHAETIVLCARDNDVEMTKIQINEDDKKTQQKQQSKTNANAILYSITLKERYTLKCGHKRIVTKNDCILIQKIHTKTSLQKSVNEMQKTKKMSGTLMLCHKCIYKVRVKQCKNKLEKLPKCLFIEIERGYKKGNVVYFYDKQVKLTTVLQIKNRMYKLISAILYKNMHYTTIVQIDKQFYHIDNSTYTKLTITDALDMIEKHGRLLTYFGEKKHAK